MSPRPGPRRPILSVRVSEQGKAEIAKRAKAEKVTPAEMARRMLAYAEKHMPREQR